MTKLHISITPQERMRISSCHPVSSWPPPVLVSVALQRLEWANLSDSLTLPGGRLPAHMQLHDITIVVLLDVDLSETRPYHATTSR